MAKKTEKIIKNSEKTVKRLQKRKFVIRLLEHIVRDLSGFGFPMPTHLFVIKNGGFAVEKIRN